MGEAELDRNERRRVAYVTARLSEATTEGGLDTQAITEEVDKDRATDQNTVQEIRMMRKLKAAVLLFFLSVSVLGSIYAQAPKASDRTATQAKPAPAGVPSFSVKVMGHGKPIILIPGLASAGAVWDGAVDHYKDRYECHVLTLAGFAGQPPIPAPFLETVRKDIARYIRDKRLQKPVIVGHSLGGFLTFWLGATEPDLVGPLVVVDGLPFLGALFVRSEDPQAIRKQAEGLRERLSSASKDQFLQQHRRTLQSMISDPKNVEIVAKWGADSDQATVGQVFFELITTDLRNDLTKIKSPTLILAAFAKENENFIKGETVQETYEKQTAKIPDHRIVLAENAKHFLMFDAPDWLFSQMDKFLKEETR